jgi:hypothetical protein
MKHEGNLSGANPTKREQWQRQFSAWRASGMTQAAYCRERKLSRHEFVYWKRVLLPIPQNKARFVAIPVRREHENLLQGGSTPPLSLVIGTRYRLEIPAGTDRDSFRTVLEVLEDRS